MCPFFLKMFAVSTNAMKEKFASSVRTTIHCVSVLSPAPHPRIPRATCAQVLISHMGASVSFTGANVLEKFQRVKDSIILENAEVS